MENLQAQATRLVSCRLLYYYITGSRFTHYIMDNRKSEDDPSLSSNAPLWPLASAQLPISLGVEHFNCGALIQVVLVLEEFQIFETSFFEGCTNEGSIQIENEKLYAIDVVVVFVYITISQNPTSWLYLK